ncbi:Dynein heavy chain, cytoplasmic [Plasmodiophora brassicae]
MAAEASEEVVWLRKRVEDALRGSTNRDKFLKSFESEETIAAMNAFLKNADVRVLSFYPGGSEPFKAVAKAPEPFKKKALMFLKPSDMVVSGANVRDLVCMDLAPSPLDNLSYIVQDVMKPLISNPANRKTWSEPAAKDVIARMNQFSSTLYVTLGQSKGKTLLPLPPSHVFSRDFPVKERTHVLETFVVGWSKQIKAVLKLDPESLIKSGLHPSPLAELDFWAAKSANLNSIHAQITASPMRAVLSALESVQSTLGAQFDRLGAEVVSAKAEANENSKYLSTLRTYFQRLNEELDFPKLVALFTPILQTMVLIWSKSCTYCTCSRLVVLVREIGNSIIEQARKFVSGATLFRLIDDENIPDAVNILHTTVDVCTSFKTAFTAAQSLAATMLPAERRWDVGTDVLFSRLDVFIERCEDILDFTKIVLEFSKLEKVHIGGTKGRSLTDTLRQVHSEFSKTVETFKAVTYDIMDVNAKEFDDDFYRFRLQIKELDRRLAKVLASAFDDCATIFARFSMLDSFEGLLDRPIIADELQKKQSLLLAQYSADLRQVQELFLDGKDSPPIHSNLPRTSGALSWCRGLIDRISKPMAKLKAYTSASAADSDENVEIQKIFTTVLDAMATYQAGKVEDWKKEIDTTTQESLRKPLLRYDAAQERYYVNFDDDVVRLLREVKYLLQMEVAVPENAIAIFNQAQTYRQQITNLQLIVNMFNEMVTTLNAVERPLVDKALAKIHEEIQPGVTEFTWKSKSVNEFIQSAMENVQKVYDVVQVMKRNLRSIIKLMEEVSKPLIERKNKALTPQDFEDNLHKLRKQRFDEIAKAGAQIQKLIVATSDALKVSKGAPQWKTYVQFVQEHVRAGLIKIMASSIEFVIENIDHDKIAATELPPMMEIKLGLYSKDVLFNAKDTHVVQGPGSDIWDMVTSWVDAFFELGRIIPRLDSQDGGDYLGELRADPGIVRLMDLFRQHLQRNQALCNDYRNEYLQFEDLWLKDRNVEFREFVARERVVEAPTDGASAAAKDGNGGAAGAGASDEGGANGDSADGGAAGQNGSSASAKSDGFASGMPPLSAFDAKILHYKSVQAKIEEKKTSIEIGWLRINAQPLKQALSTWASKWIHTYTSFLQNQITRQLIGLDTFMNDISVGLEADIPEGDTDALERSLTYIHEVRTRNASTMASFGPLRDTVAMLKRHGLALKDYELKMLDDAPVRWENMVDKVYKVKEKITPFQDRGVKSINLKAEAFAEQLRTFRAAFRDEAPFSYEVAIHDAYRNIAYFDGQITIVEKAAAELNRLEGLFELSISTYREIPLSRKENRLLKVLWDNIALTHYLFNDWKKTLWDKIDTEALMDKTKNLQKRIGALPKEMRAWKAYVGLQNEVRNMTTVLPLVNLLHSPSMQDRHWTQIMNVTSRQFTMGSSFCLADLLDLELHKFVTDVEEVVELATKENKIGNQLKKIATQWVDLPLNFGAHKDVPSVLVIKSPDEVLLALEENMAMLQGISGQGRYVEHFITEVEKWQNDLGTTETVLHDWLEVQAKWSSLQSIFISSQDIRVQLPEDSKRFDGIDADFRDLMKEASAAPNTIEACTWPGRSQRLVDMKAGLEKCEKSLNQYLETKKVAFPRFYFLSNTALLDILSNGNNPQAVQAHLGDCFDNIKKLEFEMDPATNAPTKNAIGMYSKDGDEYVPFLRPFLCDGPVETWLNGLVDIMRATLRDILERSKFAADQWEIEKPRHEWLFDYCAQIALTASQVLWTEEVESQFDAQADGNEQAFKEYLKVLNDRLGKLIGLVLGKLSREDRIKIITLITVDVHNRDVVQSLITNKVEQVNAFAWQSQLRYKWVPDSRDCKILVADASFTYSYEYIGNTGRLVITPLTDRCYITLTQALRLIMGGAPAGPAGTGKTETTKDLGRAMGLAVYVFNCSEQMNVESLGAIFKGLSQTGAWGCFDEFNRIPIEVLSVVSTQFSTILQAIREKKARFDFMGENIALVPTVGAFITMNPGYAGRTELPENLKALFRSCAMVVPDIQLICENMLMSEGFLNARPLSLKFVTLYSLSNELLSKQAHYDWGLRATKAVLRVAGALKRAEPSTSEDKILMRALRDFNLPKVVADDTPIFIRLVTDLFPGLTIDRKSDESLTQAVQFCTKECALQAEDTFILKTVQLAELLDIRHSVFVIGPTGCGKSECWKVLFRAFNRLGQKCVFEVFNPKAIRNDELYGWLSKTDWNDGILSSIMRNMSRNNPPYNDQQKWKMVVLDGDIDPAWIESLNTVMDDNKVLTLVSNERIPLTPPMRLLFEISNLAHATPATVSRAGIIYINEKDIGWKPFVDSWIASRDDEKEQSTLLSLFNKYVTPETLEYIRRNFKTIVPQSDIMRVQSLCYLLEGLLPRLQAHKKAMPANEKMSAATEKELFEMLFVFACVWAFGGALMVDKSRNYRVEFSSWFKNAFQTVKYPLPEANEPRYEVFDYFTSIEDCKLQLWQAVVPEYKVDPLASGTVVTDIVVSTPDTVRLTFLMDALVRHRKPVLFVGTAGTGKTCIVKRYLASVGDEMLSANINLNSRTDAAALQTIMEQSVDKRSGRTYGPPGNKKLIYFVDDLNMPFVDKYGTQSPEAFLRQHMDYGAWYDRAKLEKKEIKDVQYIACMNPTAGSFFVNARLMRHFTTFACSYPSEENVKRIYLSILAGHLAPFPREVQALAPLIVHASIQLFAVVNERFMPTAGNFHYVFNLRDLTNIFQGVCRSVPGTVPNGMSLARLWIHESVRVFSDRLTSAADMERFEALLKDKAKESFTDMNQEALTARPFLFATFVGAGDDGGGGARKYRQVPDYATLGASLGTYLQEYNDVNPVMDLVLFDMAMDHVARIARIIENPAGNALLVGVGGSGKQSLARLASYICGYETFQISVTKTYGIPELKADLQELYKRSGLKNAKITFLLTDSQIANEHWLVYINDLLASGYIPDLFAVEDKDAIYAALRNEARAAGVQTESKDAMQDFFIRKVKCNLHVVLCFSPVGDKFRVRCRQFPALINNTSIDWFHPWPQDALVSVAFRFLADVDVGSGDLRENIAHHMAEVHLSVNEASQRYLQVQKRYNYTTPKSFLELISFYKMLLAEKKDKLGMQTARLEKGIATLQKTQQDVSLLKEDLQRTLKIVAQKSTRATELIEVMGVERGKVEEQQALANIEAESSKGVADIANRIKGECEAELVKALPILEQASEAVNCLNKDSLTTLKSFKSPTAAVIDVTKATYILLTGKKAGKFDWNAAKKMMASVDQFLRQLKAVDARELTEATIVELKPIMAMEYFQYEPMLAVSSAAANLCKWIISSVQYNEIYKNVAPKMAAAAKATAEFEEAMAKLAVVQKKVADMKAELDKVTAKLQEAINEKNQVEEDARQCQNRLSLANRLVNGLADENERWGKGIIAFQEMARTIIGDVLLGAAFVSYIGAFDQDFRLSLWRGRWLPDLVEKGIPLTPDITPFAVLTNEATIAAWKNEGLPADTISLENGAIITQCQRWPLLIDPQLQGVKWIRGREKDLKVVSLTGPKWLNIVSNAVQNGYTVLIENLSEEIDGLLDPIISRSFFKRGRSLFIRLGGEEVSYDENFQLYLQTKLSNPHYKPEVAAQCTLINFIVTEGGLEEQLLALVVNKEKPELEERRTALVRSINQYMVNLNDLENELLQKLSNAPDDILSDVSLIEGLESTKIAAVEIVKKVDAAKEQEVAINKTRNEFRSVAAEASCLYFLLNLLQIIDHMYRYSLDAFVGFFYKAIDRTTKADNVRDRSKLLTEKIRITIYTWVSRGLFEKHKLIFSSQLVFRLVERGVLQGATFSREHFLFLVGDLKKIGQENPLPFLSASSWASIQALVDLDGFQGLAKDMLSSPNRFKDWYLKARPESSPLPLDWRKLDDTSPFMKLLVVKCMRPDRMTTAISNYVAQTLPSGKDFTELDAQNSFFDVLETSFNDSNPVTPLFFILSAGADPVQTVMALAKKLGYANGRVHRVAMGQGQDVIAMARLAAAHRDGSWVILENIHLMPRWTLDLEKKLDEFAIEGSHADFRVFLSAEPNDRIPIGLLERSIKLTNEPPQGLKANLKRAFANFDKDEFEFKDAKIKTILFGLCHFHSVVLERKKFGPKGWNVMYPFNTGDLMDSSTVLSNYLETAGEKVPWDDLRYIFGEIMYGGHITDDWDRLLCATYLKFYMRDELFDEMELLPYVDAATEEHFRAPPVLPYDEYFTYIDRELQFESPVLFGLHPNAEIGVRTQESMDLFNCLLELQPKGAAGADGGKGGASRIEQVLEALQEKFSDVRFDLDDLSAALTEEERGPYQNVFMQECARMNALIDEINRSLTELDLGLSGALTRNARMEALEVSLYMNRVPATWTAMAYPSLRDLATWVDDLLQRIAQLQRWVDNPTNLPFVVNLPYLFNPQSFLTAIMQVTAQRNNLELDKLVVQTEVTRYDPEQIDAPARDGAYVSGLKIVGARWNTKLGTLEDSLPREMFMEMPVINCRAILSDKQEKTGIYNCPVYKTQRRGPTYVFAAGLRTKLPPAKWVLNGVVLLLEVDG